MEKLLASHLRIGNYYDSSDGLTFSITPHDINELFNDPSDDYYNPIPLQSTTHLIPYPTFPHPNNS